ncbi:PREDICTED: uncharacterized protein LOC107328239 [Acropora digitifera]|uniref:uncharacterized protein LOC107328239 n=1 Tax=Acropora digitifera TaxID=70779 RepID=UPI00077ABEB1|nr:PREDICTED: uncharacterized protein LOC107328239 [Acropora digitifera]
MTLNIEKCGFAKEKIQFLWHLIGKDGIDADPSKVEAITQMEAPTNILALHTTWACERLADYLIGKTFHIETDYKPLVPLLGTKNLDEMPPRFNFTHVPGKELTTADALSRAPSKSTSRVKQEEEIELYVENILLQLPASDKRLEKIAAEQKEDPICRKLFEYCKEGWPDMIQKLPSSLSPYWSSRGEISQVQGLLLKGSCLIIPSLIRLEILDRIRDGHQGIVN